MKKTKFLLVALGILGLASSLDASVFVHQGLTRPDEHTAISYTPTTSVGRSTAYYRGLGAGYRHIGQAFTVTQGTFDMAAVTWKIDGFESGILGKNFSIKVYHLSALNVAPNGTTDLISSQSGTLPAALTDGDYLTFTLDQPVTLQNGSNYLVMFCFEEPTSTDTSAKTLGIERTDANAGFGRLWLNNNGTFSADNKASTFIIHNAAPSPEFQFGGSPTAYHVALSTSLQSDSGAQGIAQDLITVLDEITGQPSTLQSTPSQGLILGISSDYPTIAAEAQLDPTTMDGREDYVIRSSPDNLLLIGATQQGLRHAVADLLYRWGYRHFFPSAAWKVIPQSAILRLRANDVERPAFIVRNLFTTTFSAGEEADYSEWLLANRAGRGFKLNTQHAYNDIYARHDEVFDAHHEYFAKVDGVWQNAALQKKFNPANADLRQLVVDDSSAWLSANPEEDSISMEPSDLGGWDNSGDAFTQLGGPSNQAVTLTNLVASQVAAPLGKYVGMYAYNYHQTAPTIMLEPNVIVSFATRFLNVNTTVFDTIDAWRAKGLNLVGIRDYSSVFYWDCALPGRAMGGDLDYLAGTIPEYQQDEAIFYTSETENSWGPYGLGSYLTTRLLWNPSEDSEEILGDFLEKSFGPAAEPMGRFYDLMNGEKSVYVRRVPPSELYSILLEAKSDANGDPSVTPRIDSLIAYVRYVELTQALTQAWTVNKASALSDIYAWVLRAAPMHMLPTQRMVYTSRGLAFIYPSITKPTTSQIYAMATAATSNPITSSELTLLAQSSGGGAPVAPPSLIYATQSTTGPMLRQAASFIFPLPANQQTQATLTMGLIGSSNFPRYVVLNPQNQVVQSGRMTGASDVVTIESASAGNYTLVLESSPNSIKCASAQSFYLAPDNGRVDLYKFKGSLFFSLPTSVATQIVVGGSGSTEYIDVEVLAGGVTIATQQSVNGDQPFIVDIPAQTTTQEIQVKIIKPATGNFEDSFFQFNGAYTCPIALRASAFAP